MTALAIDAGGTTTRAALIRDDGVCESVGQAGPGNPIAVGAEAAARSVVASATKALITAAIPASKVDGILIAMAGGAGQFDWRPLRRLLQSAQLDCEPVLVTDSLATFFSGTWQDHGYALIAGTGAVAVRIEGGDITAMADGLGWLLGDEGSAFWIGRRVIRAGLAGLEGRGPATRLTGLMLHQLALPEGDHQRPEDRRATIDAIKATLYAGRPVDLAHFAPLAFLAEGDEVAAQIIDGAVTGLTTTLGSLLLPSETGPIVFGGGVIAHQEGLAGQILAKIGAAAASREMYVVSDGLAGAALLALRARGATGRETFDRIHATLALARR